MESHKRLVGLLFIFIGLVFLITPLTPGSIWLLFTGCNLLGIHFIFWEKIKKFIIKHKFYKK